MGDYSRRYACSNTLPNQKQLARHRYKSCENLSWHEGSSSVQTVGEYEEQMLQRKRTSVPTVRRAGYNRV